MNLHFSIDAAGVEHWGWTGDAPGYYPATAAYAVDRIVMWAPNEGGYPSPALMERARAAWPHRHTVGDRIGEVQALLSAAREADEAVERLWDRLWALGGGHWPNPTWQTDCLEAAAGARMDRAERLRHEAESVRWGGAFAA